MNDAVRDELVEAREGGVGAIRRRHVIYVERYDPRGAQSHFDLFRRTCEWFQQVWPISLTLQPLEIESDDFAHWGVDLRGSNWQVATHYDFVRMENFIRSDMAASRLLWTIGCSDATVHDAVVSARAGFAAEELCALWPSREHWELHERPSAIFSHCFVARRSERAIGRISRVPRPEG